MEGAVNSVNVMSVMVSVFFFFEESPEALSSVLVPEVPQSWKADT